MTAPVPVPAMPQRPADLDGEHTLAVLVDAYARHVLALTIARAAGRPVDPDHAVAALAIAAAMVVDLHDERWPIVRDGLAHGAGLAGVAAAMDLDADEVAAGLMSWVGRQAARGPVTDDEHAAMLALVVEGAR
jgi:hypothetical protein